MLAEKIFQLIWTLLWIFQEDLDTTPDWSLCHSCCTVNKAHTDITKGIFSDFRADLQATVVWKRSQRGALLISGRIKTSLFQYNCSSCGTRKLNSLSQIQKTGSWRSLFCSMSELLWRGSVHPRREMWSVATADSLSFLLQPLGFTSLAPPQSHSSTPAPAVMEWWTTAFLCPQFTSLRN